MEWDFSGSNEEEADTLFGILADMGKECYMAVFEDLGARSVESWCRAIPRCIRWKTWWDNTNMALEFREKILNLHRLSEEELADLVQRLEEAELDVYMTIVTLTGIEFDENTVWGQLTILELKLLIYLALGELEEAQELVEMFLQFNDNTVERGLFYQAMNASLEATLNDELELDDYLYNFRRMFGDPVMDAVVRSIEGSVRFFGLEETGMDLQGLDRHLKMIELQEAARGQGPCPDSDRCGADAVPSGAAIPPLSFQNRHKSGVCHQRA